MKTDVDRNSAAPSCYAAVFDSHPDKIGRVFIRESTSGDELIVAIDGRETKVVETLRDQWGVFVSIHSLCVAQEDGTRSFVDALISAMNEIRRRNEATIAATVE